MKRIYLLLILSLCAGISGAEVVSTITFNPSRLGTYTHLRAANSAVLAGGLATETMNVSSAGTVSVTTPSSDNIYVAREVRPVENASQVAVNMPNTTFYGNGASVGGLSSIPTVAIAGGNQTYKNKSYVYLLDAAFSLIQQVNTLKGGALTISGNAKDGRNLFSPGTHSNGFYLAGNDIPEPVAAYTNGAGDLTGCKWAWVDRQGAKVLALDGCASNGGAKPPTTSDKKCTWVNEEGALYDNALIYPDATLVDSNPTDTDCLSSQEEKIVFTKVGDIDASGHYTIFGPIKCTCTNQ